MKKLERLALGIYISALVVLGGLMGGFLARSTPAQHTPAQIPDPCFSQFTVKQNVSISVASATTTSLVAVSAGKAVYVCGGIIDIQGSATTVGSAQLEYGTGASCSSPTVLTGVMPGSITANVPTIVPIVGNGSDLTAPASNGLCIVTAGTTVGVTGFVSYVQQ
jgi:hypothetical protein